MKITYINAPAPDAARGRGRQAAALRARSASKIPLLRCGEHRAAALRARGSEPPAAEEGNEEGNAFCLLDMHSHFYMPPAPATPESPAPGVAAESDTNCAGTLRAGETPPPPAPGVAAESDTSRAGAWQAGEALKSPAHGAAFDPGTDSAGALQAGETPPSPAPGITAESDSSSAGASYAGPHPFVEEIRYRLRAGLRTAVSCGTPAEWRDAVAGLSAAGLTRRGQGYGWAPPATEEGAPARPAAADAAPAGKEGSTPAPAARGSDGRAEPGFLLSFGIHPWYADRYEPAAYRALYEACDYVGEIGMDGIWCDVDRRTQRRVFDAQLRIAAELHKPVILHTKEAEAEIAAMLAGFPENICVHWYSGDEENLHRFMALDCYFTLGADTPYTADPVRRVMLEEIPLDRLFLETDGLEAIHWAREKHGVASPASPGKPFRADAGAPVSAYPGAPNKSNSAPNEADGAQEEGLSGAPFSTFTPIAETLAATNELLASIRGVDPASLARQYQKNLAVFLQRRAR